MKDSNEASRYLLIDSSVLPDVFRKVVEAKRLIATGRARSSSEAVRMVDISRSAFYKYKDAVYPYSSRTSERLLTLYTQLRDETGEKVLPQMDDRNRRRIVRRRPAGGRCGICSDGFQI